MNDAGDRNQPGGKGGKGGGKVSRSRRMNALSHLLQVILCPKDARGEGCAS